MARERGVREGKPKWHRGPRAAGNGTAPLCAAIAGNAERHARDLASVVEDIRAGGHTSLGAIADELNARGMLTRRGGRWLRTTHADNLWLGAIFTAVSLARSYALRRVFETVRIRNTESEAAARWGDGKDLSS